MYERIYYTNEMLLTQYFFKGTFMTINPGTKAFKLFSALSTGERISPSQAAKRFGIKNIAAEASRIRHNGYAVYANTRKSANGVTVTEYEMGNPSREIVALGYKAKALGISL